MLGVATEPMRGVPPIPYVASTDAFMEGTQRNVITAHAITFAHGTTERRALPESGILGRMWVQFQGTLTCALGTGAVTPTWRWPYGLLSQFTLSTNLNANLIYASGIDLHVRRLVTNPAMTIDQVDDFAGTVGGGVALGALTNDPLCLTWEIPITTDMASLTGCLFLQSSQNDITYTLAAETLANLITLTGTASATIAGTFSVIAEIFDIPRADGGAVIVPAEVGVSHGFNWQETMYAATGDVTHVVLRNPTAQLHRLLLQVRPSDAAFLTPIASDGRINSLRVEYGANKRPVLWDPVEVLTALNNEQYGNRLPYGYLCLDNVRENPLRDVIQMGGITDLRIIPNITATLGANPAFRVVQETAFV